MILVRGFAEAFLEAAVQSPVKSATWVVSYALLVKHVLCKDLHAVRKKWRVIVLSQLPVSVRTWSWY